MQQGGGGAASGSDRRGDWLEAGGRWPVCHGVQRNAWCGAQVCQRRGACGRRPLGRCRPRFALRNVGVLTMVVCDVCDVGRAPSQFVSRWRRSRRRATRARSTGSSGVLRQRRARRRRPRARVASASAKVCVLECVHKHERAVSSVSKPRHVVCVRGAALVLAPLRRVIKVLRASCDPWSVCCVTQLKGSLLFLFQLRWGSHRTSRGASVSTPRSNGGYATTIHRCMQAPITPLPPVRISRPVSHPRERPTLSPPRLTRRTQRAGSPLASCRVDIAQQPKAVGLIGLGARLHG